MPHRVTNFLRTSSGGIPHIKRKSTTATNNTTTTGSGSGSGTASNTTSGASSRNNSVSGSPYDSDSDDHQHNHNHHAVKMPEHLADALRKQHHRLSLPLPFGRSSSKERGSRSHTPPATRHHHHQQQPPVTLDWSIESPPVIYYGSADESSGAIFSGQLFLDVARDEGVDVESLSATLAIHTVHKRPYQGHCHDCQHRETRLETWDNLLAQPATLAPGRHPFPFSTLLAGHLPASIDTPVLSISYEFRAEAVLSSSSSNSNTKGTPRTLCFERTIPVKRSLAEPLYPHHSVRVFPPTNIKAGAHYNTVIHPTASNKLTLKLDGLVTHNDRVKTVDLWKLKKVTWRLEETIKTVAPACDRHAPSAPVVTLPNPDASHPSADDEDSESTTTTTRGTVRTETRVIGEKQLHEGWKSDYSGNDGTVDMEFDYCVNQYADKNHHTHHRGSGAPPRELKYACDLRNAADGTEVTHSLQIELIVSKEYAPEGKPHLAAQTGTGRILRMHFAVTMTDFPGMGVSWDNEAPPVYQDVPPSPPGYTPPASPPPPLEPPIEYEDLEELFAQRASVEPRSD
ncbi:Endocytosis regulator [Purpureocillium takamizusanense]|uniref:Endocytosis regulator n=1 Tax=Purpureocillium takamizusanense TaxID=2060973 RepID=A0A9Q8V7Y0_9HYPO|nr:Endocytosis regulator [Purpureocillium takamizusanense]UNI16505.1 Endocytosis regulator [Purpureocillium takamizusanense]